MKNLTVGWLFCCGILTAVPASAQSQSVAVRDEVRLFLPDDVPCAELYDSMHKRISADPAYRFAEEGEAALNIEFACYVPRGADAFVFTVVTALGRSIVWARQRSIYFALVEKEEQQKALANIMKEIDEQIEDLRKVKFEFEEVDLDDYPEEAEAGGFSRTDFSLVLRDLRELLD
jgi:hypothetical protein